MNIIPLVSTFILIIGMFSLAQMQSIKYLSDEKRIYMAQQALANNLRGEIAKDHYDKVIKPQFTSDKQKKQPLTNKPQSEKKKKKENTPEQFIHFELAPLITSSQSVCMSKKWIEAMTLIYSEIPKKTIEALCKTILETEKALYKKEKRLIPLVKLVLKDEAQKMLLFKLLKGPPITRAPSLMAITSINQEKKHVIEIKTLEKAYLSVFIGEKAAREARPKERDVDIPAILATVDPAIKEFIGTSSKKQEKKIYQATDVAINVTLRCNEPH